MEDTVQNKMICLHRLHEDSMETDQYLAHYMPVSIIQGHGPPHSQIKEFHPDTNAFVWVNQQYFCVKETPQEIAEIMSQAIKEEV